MIYSDMHKDIYEFYKDEKEFKTINENKDVKSEIKGMDGKECNAYQSRVS